MLASPRTNRSADRPASATTCDEGDIGGGRRGTAQGVVCLELFRRQHKRNRKAAAAAWAPAAANGTPQSDTDPLSSTAVLLHCGVPPAAVQPCSTTRKQQHYRTAHIQQVRPPQAQQYDSSPSLTPCSPWSPHGSPASPPAALMGCRVVSASVNAKYRACVSVRVRVKYEQKQSQELR